MKLQILQLVFISIYLSDGTSADCISEVRFLAVTSQYEPEGGFICNSHKLVLNNIQGKNMTVDLPPPANIDSGYEVVLSMDDFGETGCVARSDIQQVRIEAGGDDGWYLASAKTYISSPVERLVHLTENPSLYVWIDGNEEGSYSYVANFLVLSLPNCISSITVAATTGDLNSAESESAHNIVIVIKEQEYKISLEGRKEKNEVFTKEVPISSFDATMCLQKGDVQQVRVESQGTDGWYIADIEVVADTGEVLAANNPFNMWVDGDNEDDYTYDAKRLVVKLV